MLPQSRDAPGPVFSDDGQCVGRFPNLQAQGPGKQASITPSFEDCGVPFSRTTPPGISSVTNQTNHQSSNSLGGVLSRRDTPARARRRDENNLSRAPAFEPVWMATMAQQKIPHLKAKPRWRELKAEANATLEM